MTLTSNWARHQAEMQGRQLTIQTDTGVESVFDLSEFFLNLYLWKREMRKNQLRRRRVRQRCGLRRK
jgi:hypothetical protein